jgi:PmbA protein
MIDDIKKVLDSKKEIYQWQLIEVIDRREEGYMIKGDPESDRVVESEKWEGTVYTDKGDKKQGEAKFIVLSGDSLETIEKKIDAAIFDSKLVTNEAFELVSPGGSYETLKLSDARIVECPDDVINEFHDKIHESAEELQGINLSASELFVTHRRGRLLNSKGLDLSSDRTSTFLEYVLMTEEKGKSGSEEELIRIARSRFVEDLHLKSDLKESAEFTKLQLKAELPSTGKFDVIFMDEALDTLFNWFVDQSSGVAAYQGWSCFKENEEVIKDAKGDKLTIWSNGLIDGMMGTSSFDHYGTPSGKHLVIEDNVFKKFISDARYAGYLETEATGAWANTEVKEGTTSADELLKASDKPIYLLMRFSTFEPSGITGAFSGEIRTGFRIDPDGTRTPIKGGSVSGVCSEAFQNVKLSSEKEKRESYFGPKAVRIASLEIAGK